MIRPSSPVRAWRLAALCAAACAGVAAADGRFGQTFSLRLLELPLVLAVALRAGMRAALATALLAALVWGGFRGITTRDPVPLAWEACTRFGMLAGAAFVVARLRRRVADERTVAETDALTGLANRRGFLQAVEPLCRRLAASPAPLSIVYFDVDRFKSINDAHGHAAGDRVLRSVAEALLRGTRRNDLVARWGGDEFLVALPGASEEAAGRIVARLRARLRASLTEAGMPVTLSAGVATAVPESGAVRLIEEADRRLAAAKAAGGETVAGA